MDPPYGPSPLQMEYRNKYYVVGRSHTSAGWDWAVDVDARTVRGGQAVSKQAAIRAAERLIDAVLAPGKRRLTLVRDSRDGA
jgi:phage-related tail protein